MTRPYVRIIGSLIIREVPTPSYRETEDYGRNWREYLKQEANAPDPFTHMREFHRQECQNSTCPCKGY